MDHTWNCRRDYGIPEFSFWNHAETEPLVWIFQLVLDGIDGMRVLQRCCQQSRSRGLARIDGYRAFHVKSIVVLRCSLDCH